MTKRKRVDNPGDDLFSKIDDIVGTSGGDMAQFEAYEQFDVKAKTEKLTKNARQFIVKLCDVYLDLDKVSNDEYIKAIAEIEESSLIVLLKQVKYAEHVIDSLMRQLDAGGHIEPSIYTTIRDMQKSAISIALEVSRYTRTLPEYFRSLSVDIKNSNDLGILASATERSKIPQLTAHHVGEDNTNEEFSLSRPIMGTREMMLHISDVKQDLNKAIEEFEDVEATPVQYEDDDEYEDDTDYEEVNNDEEADIDDE